MMLNFCRFNLLHHPHTVYLVKAQSKTYLFLKLKSCGSCAARQAGLFSLFVECSIFPLSLYPSLSLSIFISFSVFFPIKGLLPRYADRVTITWNKGQTEALYLCGWWAVLILFWEHVRVVVANALPLPRTCHLAGGVLSSTLHRRTMSVTSDPLCLVVDRVQKVFCMCDYKRLYFLFDL